MCWAPSLLRPIRKRTCGDSFYLTAAVEFHLKRGNVEGDVRRRSRAFGVQGCVLAGQELHSQWKEPPGLRVQHLQHQPHLRWQDS